MAYIGLGSNQGESRALCEAAAHAIAAWPEILSARLSAIYETEPHCLPGQVTEVPVQWYANAVLEISTELSVEDLFHRLLALESAFGRDFSEKGKWRARPIDLDLLAYGDLILTGPSLTVPHPHIAHRRFVLLPWSELAPQWKHPCLGRSIQDLLDKVVDDKVIKKLCSSSNLF